MYFYLKFGVFGKVQICASCLLWYYWLKWKILFDFLRMYADYCETFYFRNIQTLYQLSTWETKRTAIIKKLKVIIYANKIWKTFWNWGFKTILFRYHMILYEILNHFIWPPILLMNETISKSAHVRILVISSFNSGYSTCITIISFKCHFYLLYRVPKKFQPWRQ